MSVLCLCILNSVISVPEIIYKNKQRKDRVERGKSALK